MKNIKEKRYETDLYEPIRRYFSKNGYEVHGEVNHCDMVAVKEDELIIIELKLSLTVDLLIQATNRQRLTDQVYIAIPKPKYRLTSKKWYDLCHLVKSLELGLILVNFLKSGAKMEVLIEPSPFDRKKIRQRNKKKRERLLAEVKGRTGDHNVGGSNKTKIMTAYKENCIQIAYLLEMSGPSSPKALRQLGTGDKTLSILTKNYYGWYEKIERGIYAISEKGKKEIIEFPDIVKYFSELKPESDEKQSSKEKKR
jgi:hypothetical protein